MRMPPTFRRALGAALLSVAIAAAAQPLSTDARALLHWVMYANDHQGAPFVVIDKRQARLWLFDGQGKPAGSTPVLLGLARGDHSVPGIGERPMNEIRPHERSTPADNRISYGCINVPAAFYDQRLRALFGQRGGVVYLLPDEGAVEQVFAAPR